MTPGNTKRISPNAYQELREALPVVFHYKRPYESYLRSGLVANEARYQQTTLDLMLAVSSMKRFPDLEKHEDAAVKLAEARAAVAELRRWTVPFSHRLNEQQEAASRRESAEQQAAALRAFADDLRAIKDEFYALQASDQPQDRGRRFERFLASLFELFDLEPRSPTHSSPNKSTARSPSIRTTTSLRHAGPRKLPGEKTRTSSRRRSGATEKMRWDSSSAVGGFSKGVLDAYSESTPFMAMDGVDLVAVLDQRIRLDDLLRRKKRHGNETGECFFPVARIANV